jgi:class 3 adenylate cyclase
VFESSFGQLFSGAFDRAQAGEFTESRQQGFKVRQNDSIAIQASTGIELGHPEFKHLRVGEKKEGQGVVFFLDIRGFTKLSIALPNHELVWILQALTEAAVRSVSQFGGHVIEFTGDGVMAVFGDSHMSGQESGIAALNTTAFLMKGVQDYVNPRLRNYGTEPIRTAVGMEFGKILWSRIGVFDTTQVKPISEATFLAGKLCSSSRTNAWEAKVGAKLAEWIPDEFKIPAPMYKFISNGVEYKRPLFLFDWGRFEKANQLGARGLRQHLLERKLESDISASPYLFALKALAEADYAVFLDETTDIPHLVVELNKNPDLAAIITFGSDLPHAAPSVYVRQNEHFEKIEIDPTQWTQGGAELSALMEAIRKAWIN